MKVSSQKIALPERRISTHIGVFIFLTILVFLIGFFSAPTKEVRAQFGQPFGGLSYEVFTCTCSDNFAIFFDDLTEPNPIGLPLVYQPGETFEYDYNSALTPGVWLLGLFNEGGECLYYVGVSCSTEPTAGTIDFVGSSMGA